MTFFILYKMTKILGRAANDGVGGNDLLPMVAVMVVVLGVSWV